MADARKPVKRAYMSIDEVAEYFGVSHAHGAQDDVPAECIGEPDRPAVADPDRGGRSAGEADLDQEVVGVTHDAIPDHIYVRARAIGAAAAIA